MTSFSHDTLEDGIHQFLLLDKSFQTTDELFEYFSSIWQNHPPSQTLRLMGDVRAAGHLPARPAFEHIRQLQSRYGNRACRVAIVSKRNMMDSLVGDLYNTIGFEICFFYSTEPALAWLRSDIPCKDVT